MHNALAIAHLASVLIREGLDLFDRVREAIGDETDITDEERYAIEQRSNELVRRAQDVFGDGDD